MRSAPSGLRASVVRILLNALADPVDLLVDLRAVVVAELPSARRLELHALRMPRANARNLSSTLGRALPKPRKFQANL